MTDFDWQPFESDRMSFDNIGDDIVGEIVKLEVKSGQNGDYPLLTLRTDEGDDKEVHASATDLKAKLAHIAPQVGDKIAVRLVELRPTGRGNPMKVFAIRHKEGDRAPASDFDGSGGDTLDDYSSEPF